MEDNREIICDSGAVRAKKWVHKWVTDCSSPCMTT